MYSIAVALTYPVWYARLVYVAPAWHSGPAFKLLLQSQQRASHT